MNHTLFYPAIVSFHWRRSQLHFSVKARRKPYVVNFSLAALTLITSSTATKFAPIAFGSVLCPSGLLIELKHTITWYTRLNLPISCTGQFALTIFLASKLVIISTWLTALTGFIQKPVSAKSSYSPTFLVLCHNAPPACNHLGRTRFLLGKQLRAPTLHRCTWLPEPLIKLKRFSGMHLVSIVLWYERPKLL